MNQREEVNAEKARLSVLGAIFLDKMRRRAKLNQTELAHRMGVSKSRVSQILDGQSNLTLETLAQVSVACGLRLSFKIINQVKL